MEAGQQWPGKTDFYLQLPKVMFPDVPSYTSAYY